MPVSSLVVATCMLKSWLVASDLDELLDMFDMDTKLSLWLEKSVTFGSSARLSVFEHADACSD